MSWSSRYFVPLLILVTAAGFFTRFWRLHLPQSYYFDEVYHAPTVKLIAEGDSRAFEWWHTLEDPATAIDWLHPPLAKYLQAAGVKAFGYTSFGWRVSSAMTGVIIILVVGFMSAKLYTPKVGLLAALFTTANGLLLVLSRIVMNDIFLVLLVLLSYLAYSQYKKSYSTASILVLSLVVGLCLATKWTGFFVWSTLGLFIVRKYMKVGLVSKSTLMLHLLAYAILPPVMYLLSYSQAMWQNGVGHIVELHSQIWHYQTNLKADHTYSSSPSEWFFNTRPVWLAVEGDKHIYAMGNPLLELLHQVVILSIAVSIINAKKHARPLPETTVELFFLYTMLWIPWVFSPRILFYYHYAPATAIASILAAQWVVAQEKWLFDSFIILISGGVVCSFIFWFPHWTLLQAPESWQEIYFMFESWK